MHDDKSALRSDPATIVRYWRAIELFTPQTLPKPDPDHDTNPVFEVPPGTLAPWQPRHSLHRRPTPKLKPDAPRGEKRPRVWRYTVQAGPISVIKARDHLEQIFGESKDSAVHDQREPDEAAVLSFQVSPTGCAVPGTFILSSFAWAYGRSLSRWPNPPAGGDGWLSGFDDTAERMAGEFDQELGDRAVSPPHIASFVRSVCEALGLGMGLVTEDRLRVSAYLVKDKTSATAADDASGQVDQKGSDPANAGRTTRHAPGETQPTAEQAANTASKEQAKQEDDTTQTVDPLNSLFIGELADVAEAIDTGNSSPPLDAYLGGELAGYVDLRKDVPQAWEALRPKNFPVGRWPGKGRHPLVFSQQVGANLAFRQLDGSGSKGGLMAINGPPGTGKTTLLKDVLAEVVVRRAMVLAEYEQPSAAFHRPGRSNLAWKTSQWKQWFSPMKEELFGFEVVVASSNNGAVENVTLEFPKAEDVDDTWGARVSPFGDVASALLGENGSAWSLMAARLGRQRNRQDFVKTFWDDRDCPFPKTTPAENKQLPGMCSLLERESLGVKSWSSAVSSFKQAMKREQTIRSERVRCREALDVCREYTEAKEKEQCRLAEAEAHLHNAEGELAAREGTLLTRVQFLRDELCNRLATLKRAQTVSKQSQEAKVAGLRERDTEASRLLAVRVAEGHQALSDLQVKAAADEALLASHQARPPARWKRWISGWVKLQTVQNWEDRRWHLDQKLAHTQASLLARETQLQTLLRDDRAVNARLEGDYATDRDVERLASRRRKLECDGQQVRRYLSWLAEAIEGSPTPYRGEPLLGLPDAEAIHELLRLRMEVRRQHAEVMRCRERIQALGDLIDREGKPFDEYRRRFRNRDIAKTIVQLGSDTRKRELSSPWGDAEWNEARVGVFLAALDLHDAFVYHAGKPMLNNLRGAMKILRGNAPTDISRHAAKTLWASLFMLVPLVSTTFASFHRQFAQLGAGDIGWLLIDEAGQAAPQHAAGALWRSRRALVVGDPLQLAPVVTVPERLQEALRCHFGVGETWMPGFTSVQVLADRVSRYGSRIANTWVGAPLLVHRRCDDPMFTIANNVAYDGAMVMGKPPLADGEVSWSAWVNVKTTLAEQHWVPAEGAAVVSIARQLVANGISLTEVFLISPFRTVVERLRHLVRAEKLKDVNVGTIHTVQGKEAKVVILVLGGDPSREGALMWASSTPNLVNVAVSRAKRHLFVVGDSGRWTNYPYFSVCGEWLREAAPDLPIPHVAGAAEE